jgi:two-component system sensor histidine kinase BaeS
MKRRIPLALKLGLAFVVLILLAVALVYFLTARSITQQFDEYRQESREKFGEQLADQLAWYREWNGSWKGVLERMLTRPTLIAIGEQVIEGNALIFDVPITLADRDGRIITTTENARYNQLIDALREAQEGSSILEEWLANWEGLYLAEEEIAGGIPIVVGDSREGTLLIGDVEPEYGPDEAKFLASAMRSALLGGGIAIGMALILSFLLIAQILSPLRVLSRATDRVAQGDLPDRIRISSRDELGQLGLSFDHMVDSLRRSETLRRTMTADIAHELRTPVTIIQGTLEAILDGIYDPSNETIAPIYEETLHLGSLIDDLRDLALAEAGELRLATERTDIVELVRQVAETAGASVEQSPTVRVESAGEIPAVSLDPKRFRQVLANLLSNALIYTPADGDIRVDLRRVEDSVELSVSDTGPGISNEDLPHLFERFYRGDPARGRTGGSGLGLAIVRQWVEAHGGTIRAENRHGGGARFVLRIPIS